MFYIDINPSIAIFNGYLRDTLSPNNQASNDLYLSVPYVRGLDQKRSRSCKQLLFSVN